MFLQWFLVITILLSTSLCVKLWGWGNTLKKMQESHLWSSFGVSISGVVMKASKLASFVTLMKITCPLEICSSPCAHNPGGDQTDWSMFFSCNLHVCPCFLHCSPVICDLPCLWSGQLSDSEGIVNSLSGPYKLLNSQPSDSGAFYSVVVQGKKCRQSGGASTAAIPSSLLSEAKSNFFSSLPRHGGHFYAVAKHMVNICWERKLQIWCWLKHPFTIWQASNFFYDIGNEENSWRVKEMPFG